MALAKIDSGKHTTKIEYKDMLISFDSKVDLGKAQFETNSTTIIYDNEQYVVGEEAHTYDLSLSKNTPHHKKLIYTAIGKVIDNETRIDIVIGTPLSLFFNEKEKQEYIDEISNNGDPITITINGVKKYFIIDNVIVAPETLGGSLLDFAQSKKKIRGVLDIGGLNAGGMVYSLGKPIRKSMFTLNKGTHILESDLRQEIMQQTGRLLEDYTLKNYLLNGCKDMQVQKIIDTHCNKFVNDIVTQCKAANWDLWDNEVYLMGGGSILLEKYLDVHFKNPVFARDVYANVKAFGIFGEKKLAKK